ncbi:unnamed protein product [Pedinophyceae sp. YPF-701]|nr:unnamed protein product [Pedinophyceae sp. YPF-701]
MARDVNDPAESDAIVREFAPFLEDALKAGRGLKGRREEAMVNIALVGHRGAGKSSLVNTLDSLLKGRVSRRAPVGDLGGGPVTRHVRHYCFAAQQGVPRLADRRPVPLRLYDTSGDLFAATDEHGPHDLFNRLMDGHLGHCFPCDTEGDEAEWINNRSWNSSPMHSNQGHACLLVVSRDAIHDYNTMQKYRWIHQHSVRSGKATYILITKVAEMRTPGGRAPAVFSQGTAQELRSKVAASTGCNASRIFCTDLIGSSVAPPTDSQRNQLLYIIKHILRAVEDHHAMETGA